MDLLMTNLLLILRLILIFRLFLSIKANLHPSSYETKQAQCEKLAETLTKVIASNPVIRNGTVNIVIADYSLQLNTNCILESIVKSDDRVVVHSLTTNKNLVKGTDFDYFVLIDDFIADV